MEITIEDLLYEWALYRFPHLLQDPELFEGLIRFVDALLTAAVRRERADAYQRLLRVSTS